MVGLLCNAGDAGAGAEQWADGGVEADADSGDAVGDCGGLLCNVWGSLRQLQAQGQESETASAEIR